MLIHDAGRDFMTERPNSNIFQQKQNMRHEMMTGVMKSVPPVMKFFWDFMTAQHDFMTRKHHFMTHYMILPENVRIWFFRHEITTGVMNQYTAS